MFNNLRRSIIINSETEPHREALLNGKRVHYDACATNVPLDFAKEAYSNFVYIGSSNVYYINGVRNDAGNPYHFFIRKPKQQATV